MGVKVTKLALEISDVRQPLLRARPPPTRNVINLRVIVPCSINLWTRPDHLATSPLYYHYKTNLKSKSTYCPENLPHWLSPQQSLKDFLAQNRWYHVPLSSWKISLVPINSKLPLQRFRGRETLSVGLKPWERSFMPFLQTWESGTFEHTGRGVQAVARPLGITKRLTQWNPISGF